MLPGVPVKRGSAYGNLMPLGGDSPMERMLLSRVESNSCSQTSAGRPASIVSEPPCLSQDGWGRGAQATIPDLPQTQKKLPAC